MTDTSADFDWTSNESIAVHEQPAIAVYCNSYGQVVLRRERSWDEEEDCFIPIARENVLTIVRAILVAADMEDCQLHRVLGDSDGLCEFGEDIEWPEKPDTAFAEKPKDRTAAERMRKYRDRKRNGSDITPVTVDRNAVTEEPGLRLVAAE